MDTDRGGDEEHHRTISICSIQGQPTERMDSQTGQLTDAYLVGIKLREQLHDGTSFRDALRTLSGSV